MSPATRRGSGGIDRIGLRGPRLLCGGGFFDLPLDIGDAGEGADADLVVGALDALLALPLCSPAAEERAEVAAKEAQGNGDERRARQWEDGVNGDDRGRRQIGRAHV